MTLHGWSRARTVLVMRRLLRDDRALAVHEVTGADPAQLSFVELLAPGKQVWEYTVLV